MKKLLMMGILMICMGFSSCEKDSIIIVNDTSPTTISKGEYIFISEVNHFTDTYEIFEDSKSFKYTTDYDYDSVYDSVHVRTYMYVGYITTIDNIFNFEITLNRGIEDEITWHIQDINKNGFTLVDMKNEKIIRIYDKIN